MFIDEIDAIGGNRKHWESHSRKTLNQLLVEMDGFEANEGVIVLAATNLPETLDPALKRPGRFDRQVAVPLPDVRGRGEILKHYLKDKPVAADMDVDIIARQTAGGARRPGPAQSAALRADGSSRPCAALRADGSSRPCAAIAAHSLSWALAALTAALGTPLHPVP